MDDTVHDSLELSVVEHGGGNSRKKLEADVRMIGLVDFFILDVENIGMSKGVIKFLVVVELLITEFVID